MSKREISICQQTRALLYKNVLKKWRMKRESSWWLNSFFIVLYLYLVSSIFDVVQIPELPSTDLGRIDAFNDSDFVVAYTPISKTTQQIINKIASTSFMKGIKVFGVLDQEAIEVIIGQNRTEIVGIIFHDTFSYELKFFWGHRIPPFEEHEDHGVHCYRHYQDPRNFRCVLENYWISGFVAFQAAMNAAIIEITTNHSVMDKMMAVTGIKMKTLPFISKGEIANEVIIFFYIISFTPLIYFASLNVAKERKKAKEWMKMMGLQDSAFWLSWGVLYAGFIFIMATCMALIVTYLQLIIIPGYFVIFTLFFIYGLSLVAFAFLVSVLIKRPVLSGSIILLLIVFWGTLGFTSLHRQLPVSLEWILCLLSPFAFTHGMIQMVWMDYNVRGVSLHDPTGRSHALIATIFMLIFDTILYLALTLYFDKILPNEYGYRRSPLFFLKFRHQQHQVVENETSPEYDSDSFEPISSEFHGKEAIRIRNIRKEYKGKTEKVKALKGLQLDIYEGQITAILGHSGAGKSTLLNILSGLIVPTGGSATIYNNKLSDKADLEKIRKIIGVCPQFNVQFDFLTMKENLRVFAEIKGIQPQKVEQEIQRVITELEMKNIQDTIAENLSGGQKRKLTFAIAILGDPQVLLLDEPTVGLDPFSRHQVWNLLKEHKSDKGILLSTQFMDEADILADRKVFMSNGQLKCAGSSLFLKRKWGIGYRLSLHKNEHCDSETITSLVKHHIPDAKLREESEEKLVYTLPFERTDKFPDLYRDIDSYNGQGIVHYGVSMATLNEVFLKLEGKTATDEADFGNWVQAQTEGTRNSEGFVELDQPLSSLPGRRKVTLSRMALWRRQVWAIARLRFLKLKHDRKTFLTLLLVFGMASIPYLLEVIINKIFHQETAWGLSPKAYFLSPGQNPQSPLTSLLIINNTGSNIEDFIDSLKYHNLLLEVRDFENKNDTDDPSYNGAIIVSGTKKDYEFSVVCNTKRLNCFPVLVDIISNGLLKMFNSSKQIQTERSIFSYNSMELWLNFLNSNILWLSVATSISPYIAMSSIYDYKIKAQAQLRISGLYPSAYWCGQALVDIPLYLLILLLTLTFMYVCKAQTLPDSLYDPVFMFAKIFSGIGYTASNISFLYVISFIFRKGKKNSNFWSLCFFTVSILLIDSLQYFYSFPYYMLLCIILVPSFTLLGICDLLVESYYKEANNDGSGKNIFFIILIPYLQCIIFVFVLRYLERMKYGKKLVGMDPVFRIFTSNKDGGPNPEEPETDYEDVQEERERTASALTASNFDEKPVIIASCLRKEYESKKKSCFAKKKKKLAIRNISFCVKKGEILGLLGHNGAGKSTAIKMISGHIRPTAGKVVLKRSGSPMNQHGHDILPFLGYCAQENSLWKNITVREHLEMYAAVKGMDKEDATVMISRYGTERSHSSSLWEKRLADALALQEHMNFPVNQLSPGINQKLCFALSILGNPAVLLLDEPSTGMDPEGQQQIWQAIRATVKNKENGAILTTHYMAEAEAVCDRVAIMVSGQLRCIGSIEHLKSKFGKDYLLEIQVKEPGQVMPLHAEILKLFPRAVRQERYSSSMAYKLPVEDVQPLSQAFSKLEAAKCAFNLEEYSLSQSTLEQVFLELSKDQELGDFEEELDTTVKWKLLPQEEP
ncbi:ATP-binding cassette sub-family A member 9-like isoform X2 [Trichosurus vulpecula]|uniref:ATP-binding cassette sub-family A member 9-like isoform X2 n=1 Tax=Trichosurus vulpecula TaxID=9337 RepID=UPI00186AF4CD|nr:ATP-binding cassette sub-family A member 9-like isoform X2 [Trichosurus vulpecula]